MGRLRSLLLLSAFALTGVTPTSSPPPRGSSVAAYPTIASSRSVIAEGEELLYEVRWSMFKLGTIRFKTFKTLRQDSTERFSAVAFMDSYEGLPFVNLHALTYTEMDTLFVSRGAQSLEKKKSRWWILHYIFDPPRGNVYVEESWQDNLTSPPATRKMIDTLRVDMQTIEDSFSLAFFARANAQTHQIVSVPLVINGTVGTAHLTFTGAETTEEIDAVEYPVRAVPVEGTLDVTGLFGLTGDFNGWFSDDYARVPLKATMDVILGQITVELKEWSRKGWAPPR